jgi:phosphotransferase system HPr (HPr) family protein
MPVRSARVGRPEGLHARPCAAIAAVVRGSQSRVRVRSHDADADGASIFELLTLAAPAGARIEVSAEGPDAERVLEEVVRILVAAEA